MKSLTRVFLTALLLSFVLTVVGCDPPLISKRTIERVVPVEIAKDAFYTPLPLTDTPLAGSFNQTITIEVGKEHHTFLSQLEVDSEHLTMVGLATFGARIFTLKYNGERLEFATIPQVAAVLKPEHLLAEFQLASWPLEPIAEQMAQTPARHYWLTAPRKLEITESPGNRSIYFGGLKVINIDYKDGDDGSKEIVFHNLDRGYTLYITQFPETEF